MTMERTPEEQMRFVVGKLAGYMADHIREKVPATGCFRSYSIVFDIPLTGNQGVLMIEHVMKGEQNQRGLQIGAIVKGTDRLRSNILLRGTSEELITYLEGENIVDELIPYFQKHSDMLDDE